MTQPVVFTTRPLARCWKTSVTCSPKPFFSSLCTYAKSQNGFCRTWTTAGTWHSQQSLPLDHLLVVGSQTQLIHLNFSLACVLNNRHIPSHKTASVGLEPQLVHDTSLLSLPLDHLLVVGSLAQLIHLIFLSACIIKIQQFLNHKTTSVGLEPQLVHDTNMLSLPLDHLLVVGSLAQLIHLIFFSSFYN
jgi:hypothetical protein